MRRKVKNSLIIIVVLVVILGLGYGIYKIFFIPKPLKIKDLENMHITITRASIDDGWDLQIHESTWSGTYYGSVNDNGNHFEYQGASETPLAVGLWIVMANEAPNIQAGDTIEITYDGGQTLKIYLPSVTEEDLKGGSDAPPLYIATDGSTYYDKNLTKLAQKALIPSEKSK